MRGLGSFFKLHNHPFPEGRQGHLATHDWSNELRIVRGTLLRCSQLVLQSIHLQKTKDTIFDEKDATSAFGGLATSAPSQGVGTGVNDASLTELAATLGDACFLCKSLLELRHVSLHAFTNLGEDLDRNLGGLESTNILAQLSNRRQWLNIPVELLDLTRKNIKPATLAADIRLVFSSLFKLIEYLRYVETFLREDQSLKQTLPIFTLVHEEGRSLVELIENRALRIEGLEKNIVEALDSMNYAIRMELRKVFGHELVALSSLSDASAIYVKVENSHGLLRDSCQQSVIGLARLFDPQLDAARLFDTFQTKLEQSLRLRRDLWTLIEVVRRCEDGLAPEAIAGLFGTLADFREGSLRYLMFKDWETSERIIEEIEATKATKGSPDLASVLHRFAAYLEALLSQVNMRAVLANHPFETSAPQGL